MCRLLNFWNGHFDARGEGLGREESMILVTVWPYPTLAQRR